MYDAYKGIYFIAAILCYEAMQYNFWLIKKRENKLFIHSLPFVCENICF